MKTIYSIPAVLFFLLTCFSSCSDYLDVVPDDIATIDHAFSNKNIAERYLFTCYSYIPDHATGGRNIGLMGADETWTFYPIAGNDFTPWQIARGNQNANDPYMNHWEGREGGGTLYNAIRDCNIFLENVGNLDKIYDLSLSMRKRWLSEAKFLKAYYHFLLFRMYGPIVIIDENLPVYTEPENIILKRAPVDEVVDYMIRLLDEAYEDVPQTITNITEELGRITKPAVLSLKARILVTAASPLFNGNPDYADFTDKEGVHLFNTEYDYTKWEKAVAACKAAVESCEESNIKLYTFESHLLSLTDTTRIQMSIRNSLCEEKFNPETIWGLSGRRVEGLQEDCMARIDPNYLLNMWSAREYINPTINITDRFYTENGVPIEEDKDWHYNERYEIREILREDRFNLVEGYTTVAMHMKREPRFYANVAFDGSIWYMQNSPSGSDENTWTVKGRAGQPQSKLGAYNYSVTGYWTKKLVNWKFVLSTSSCTRESYAWPEIRLADLYLLYAEALNETGQGEEAITWLDKVRERAGLKGIKESWTQYSIKPDKYTTTEGLREIIKQERSIELVFEGHRFWDLRRWKDASKELNQRIYGWDIDQETPEAYYRQKTLFTQEFIAPRDYLWPIRQEILSVNTNLVQNPGW